MLAHLGYTVTIGLLLWWNGGGSFHSTAPWAGLVCLQYGWTGWKKMSLNLKGSALTGVGTQGFMYFPLYLCNSRVMQLFSRIRTQQFYRNLRLQLKINPLLCYVLIFFFEFLWSSAGLPLQLFWRDYITRTGSLSRIQADVLHQSYSAICHRDTNICRAFISSKEFIYFTLWSDPPAYRAFCGSTVESLQ